MMFNQERGISLAQSEVDLYSWEPISERIDVLFYSTISFRSNWRRDARPSWNAWEWWEKNKKKPYWNYYLDEM